MILSPIVTLPVSMGILLTLPNCGIDEPWWQLNHIRLALLPGSMDLVAFVWLASANSQVRKAAATSGVIGIIRVALPLLAVGYYAARSGVQENNPACDVSSFLLIPLALLIIGLWAFTALISAFVLWRVTRATAA